MYYIWDYDYFVIQYFRPAVVSEYACGRTIVTQETCVVEDVRDVEHSEPR
jgi:hypothetical protein